MARKKNLRIATGLLVVLIVAILFLVHTSPVKNWVAGLLRDYLATSHGIGLELNQLDYNLFALSFHLGGLRLRVLDAPDQLPLLEVDETRFVLSLLNWLRGRPHFTNIEIRRPVVNVVIKPETDAEVLAMQPSPVGDADRQLYHLPDFRIDEAVLEDGRLWLRQEAFGLLLDLQSIDVTVKGSGAPARHRIEVRSIRLGNLQIREIHFPLDELEILGSLGSDRMEIERFFVRSGSSQIRVAGELASDGRMSAESALRVDLVELSRMMPDLVTEGHVTLDSVLEGMLPALRAIGNLRGGDVTIQDVSDIDISGEFEWDLAGDTVELRPFRIESANGSLVGETKLTWGSALDPSHLALQLNDINLGPVLNILSSPVEVANTVSGTFSASWPLLAWNDIVAEGELAFTPKSASSRAALPLAGSVGIRYGEQRADPSLSGLRAFSTRIDGQVTLQPDLKNSRRLSGVVRGQTANVEVLLSGIERLFDGPAANRPTMGGRAGFQLELGGFLHDPQVGLLVEGTSLSVGTFDFIDLQARGTYHDRRLSLDQWGLQVQSLSVLDSGVLGLGDEEPRVEISGELAPFALASLADILRLELFLNGEVKGSFWVEGSLTDPEVELDLSGHDLNPASLPFNSLELQAQLKDRQLILEEVVLRPKEGEELRAAGVFDLVAQDYRVRASSAAFPLSVFTSLDGRTSVEGALDFVLEGEGNLNRPQLFSQIRIAQFKLNDLDRGEIHIQATLEDHDIQLSVETTQLGVSVQGQANLKALDSPSLQVQLKEFDLSLPAEILGKRPSWRGAASGQLQLQGPLRDWHAASAQLTLSTLEMEQRSLNIKNVEPIAASWRDESLSVDSLTIVTGHSQLEVSGSIPLARIIHKLSSRSGGGAVRARLAKGGRRRCTHAVR